MIHFNIHPAFTLPMSAPLSGSPHALLLPREFYKPSRELKKKVVLNPKVTKEGRATGEVQTVVDWSEKNGKNMNI